MRSIILDLDGCLSDHRHRKHFSTKKDWDKYNAGMMNDAPVIPVVELGHAMRERGYTIVVCTGRFESYRYKTLCWLERHGILVDYLFMRADGDMRSDYIVKEDMYTELVANGFDILFVVDDRKTVVDMWRSKGLMVFHCDEGDFLRE